MVPYALALRALLRHVIPEQPPKLFNKKSVQTQTLMICSSLSLTDTFNSGSVSSQISPRHTAAWNESSLSFVARNGISVWKKTKTVRFTFQDCTDLPIIP